MSRKPTCRTCGDRFHPARFQAGYRVCLPCGETAAKTVRYTVAPLHKSNYMLITSRTDLAGLNNKGGLVR